jgi:RNA polymerase sigma-70 factor, ECF subfamily
VMGWADVGGMLPSVSRPTVGSQEVAEGVMRLFRAGSGTTLVAHAVNGEPGIIALRHGAVRAVIALTVKQGLITRLYAQADQRKLAHVRHALDQARHSADA